MLIGRLDISTSPSRTAHVLLLIHHLAFGNLNSSKNTQTALRESITDIMR